MPAPEITGVLREVRNGLAEIYGSRLSGCYLYGSHARGEARSGSDVDILIVLEDYTSYSQELARTSQLIESLSLRYNAALSRVFLRRAEWLSGDNPFLENVREEAVPA